MSEIQIVIDSTAYFTEEYIKENNLEVVSLAVEIDDYIDKEGLPGSYDNYYEKLKASKNFPKTSQPPVGEFVEIYEKALNSGKKILAIIFSSKLSGTYNTACMAADMIDTKDITVIDTMAAVGNYRKMIDTAVVMSKSGSNVEEIVDKINKIKERMNVNLTVDTLEYLKRGGRLTNAQAVVGTLLNIKPIIGLIDGKLIATEKVRGKKKAIDYMISEIPGNVKSISIDHVQNIEECEKIKQKIKERFADVEISINEIGPVIGSHIGPKAIGICSTW